MLEGMLYQLIPEKVRESSGSRAIQSLKQCQIDYRIQILGLPDLLSIQL